MSQDSLLEIVNTIIEGKGETAFEKLEPHQRLREDLGLDSLDLAELTVRVDKRFGVDVFEDGVVNTIDELTNKIQRHVNG